ncbi:unnamed protein product [Brassica oleracea var. botrytis]|uniref:Uncharacterized protein n=1 Tax=Brassica oleracea TaxID=3712 RepID=A0A3P6G1Z9_BRAOL|nr:unnamed protein product [Brassica oleracea]
MGYRTNYICFCLLAQLKVLDIYFSYTSNNNGTNRRPKRRWRGRQE